MKNHINNSKNNKETFNKKGRYKLYIAILAASLVLGSILGSRILKNKFANNANEDYFVKVDCNYIDYENIDDMEHVSFLSEDGEIVGYTDINNKGETGNLTVYLEPGKYYAINGTGGKETMIEFVVKNVNEELVLDIDCNDGSMELHRNKANPK